MLASIHAITDKMDEILKSFYRKKESIFLDRERVESEVFPEAGTANKKVTEHVFYGMHKDMGISPQDELNNLRDSRRDDL